MGQYTVYAAIEIKAEGRGASEQEVLEKALKTKKYEILDAKIGSRIVDNYITVAEYARMHNLQDCIYLSQVCKAGKMPGAVRIGRDWCIPADTPRTDRRVKSGKYVGQHKKYYKKPQDADAIDETEDDLDDAIDDAEE